MFASLIKGLLFVFLFCGLPSIATAQSWINFDRAYKESSFRVPANIFAELARDLRISEPVFDVARKEDAIVASYLRTIHTALDTDLGAASQSARQLSLWIRRNGPQLSPKLGLLTHLLAFELNRLRGETAEQVSQLAIATRGYCDEVKAEIPECWLIAAKYELRFYRSHLPKESGDQFLREIIVASDDFPNLADAYERFFIEALSQFEHRVQTQRDLALSNDENALLLASGRFFATRAPLKHFSALVMMERYYRVFGIAQTHSDVLDALLVSLSRADLPPAHQLRISAELALQYDTVVTSPFDDVALNRLSLEFVSAKTIGLQVYTEEFYDGILGYLWQLPNTVECANIPRLRDCAISVSSSLNYILSDPADPFSDQLAGIWAIFLSDLYAVPKVQDWINSQQYFFPLDVAILGVNRVPGMEKHILWPQIWEPNVALQAQSVFRDIVAKLPPRGTEIWRDRGRLGRGFKAAFVEKYDQIFRSVANSVPSTAGDRLNLFLTACSPCEEHVLWSRFVEAYGLTIDDRSAYSSRKIRDFNGILSNGTQAFQQLSRFDSVIRLTDTAEQFHARFPRLLTSGYKSSFRYRRANALAQAGRAREAIELYLKTLIEVFDERLELESQTSPTGQARRKELLSNELSLLINITNTKLSLPQAGVTGELRRIEELSKLVPDYFDQEFRDWREVFQRTLIVRDRMASLNWEDATQVAQIQSAFDLLALQYAQVFDPAGRLVRDPLSKRVLKSVLALAPLGKMNGLALRRFVNPDLKQAEREFRLSQLATDFDGRSARGSLAIGLHIPKDPKPEAAPRFGSLAQQFVYIQEVDDNWLNAALGFLGQAGTPAGAEAEAKRQELLNLQRWQWVDNHDREIFVQAPKSRTLVQASQERLQQNLVARRQSDIIRNLSNSLLSDGFDKPVLTDETGWGYKYGFTNSTVALRDLIGFDPISGVRPALLRPSEALVVLRYVPDEGRFVVFAASQDTVAKAAIDIEPDKLEELIVSARRSVASPSKEVDLWALSELFQLAFGNSGIARVIADKSDWLVVPQGPLTRLPINTLLVEPPVTETSLPDYSKQKWLAFEKSVFVLPSVTALTLRQRQRVGEGASTDDGVAISVGNPYFSLRSKRRDPCELATRVAVPRQEVNSAQSRADRDSDFWRAVTPLPCAGEEAEAISEALTTQGWDVTKLVSRDATEANLARLERTGDLAGADIIHFATHSYFPKTKSRRFVPTILMSPVNAQDDILREARGPPELAQTVNDHWTNDGHLSSNEILGMRLSADMVILSACETMNQFGEESAGFANFVSSFLFAGAERLIVSQWLVADKATADLLTDVINIHVQRDGGGTQNTWNQALRRSMRAMLDGKLGTDDGVDRAHPYFWAPFQLMGVPQ